jgi:hypothetical protein
VAAGATLAAIGDLLYQRVNEHVRQTPSLLPSPRPAAMPRLLLGYVCMGFLYQSFTPTSCCDALSCWWHGWERTGVCRSAGGRPGAAGAAADGPRGQHPQGGGGHLRAQRQPSPRNRDARLHQRCHLLQYRGTLRCLCTCVVCSCSAFAFADLILAGVFSLQLWGILACMAGCICFQRCLCPSQLRACWRCMHPSSSPQWRMALWLRS